MIKLSIIIPVYFNEDNLFPLYDKLKEVIINDEYEYELVFVDDGSLDTSYEKLKELRKMDDNIKLIKLSKNFGSHTAILAGLTHCTGDCATVISADLQDPPMIINQMFEKYIKGNQVILAVRQDREESIIQKMFSNTYYKLMRKFALSNMPLGGFDCFMIDRKIVDIIKNMKEKNSSIMGQVLWCGFKTEKIYYVRKEREIGKSRWTLSKKIKLFIDSFMAFSYFPIKIMSTVGIFLSLVSFIYAIFILYNSVINKIPVAGWSTLMIVFLLVSGIQMILLGMVGEYLWRNFDETRKRPIYIIDESIGFDE